MKKFALCLVLAAVCLMVSFSPNREDGSDQTLTLRPAYEGGTVAQREADPASTPDWTPLKKSGSIADQMVAQRYWRGRRGYRGDYRNAGRNGVPEWEINEDYPGDLFTFARVKYGSRGGWGKWATDYRDSDLNFSLRLHQLTTLKVNPEPVVVELTDKNLFDYPFLYMIEPGELYFTEAEVVSLRKYCLNGGFLMVDDFWGDDQYRNLERQLLRVFPDRRATEVPLKHEIFHNVYDLKEKPQIPAIGQARRRADGTIETWERSWNNDTQTPHYRAIYDDADRIMIFICHNTDLGDGWEREGEDQWYFEEFSVKKAYPLGINIVTYAMTH